MAPKYTVEDFYVFNMGAMWRYFKAQHFAFWMICGYLFFEFVRPQALFPQIDILPWAQVFLLGSLIGAVVDPSVKWTSSPANKWMILFLISIVISIQTALYPDIAKKHFMDFFGWFIIYFLIICIINTKERFYIFAWIFILAAGKIAIGTSKAWAMRGFSFAGWGLMGPRGYFENSGELAILMLTLFPLAYFIYKAHNAAAKLWEKILLIVFWVCPILTILGASSRGAQLALAVQLVLMFRGSILKIKPLIGIFLLVFGLLTLLPQEQKDRFSSAGEDRTSQQRLLYWKHGRQMILDHPLTGVGFFNFIPYYEENHSNDMLYPYAQLPHNIFIQVGTDAGIPLMIYLLMLVVFCLLSAWKIARNDRIGYSWRCIGAGLGYGVLGFFIAGQFVTVTYYPFLWIHLALLASLRNIMSIQDKPKIPNPSSNPQMP